MNKKTTYHKSGFKTLESSTADDIQNAVLQHIPEKTIPSSQRWVVWVGGIAASILAIVAIYWTNNPTPYTETDEVYIVEVEDSNFGELSVEDYIYSLEESVEYIADGNEEEFYN